MSAFYKCATSSQQIAHFFLTEADGVTKELTFDKRGLLLHGARVYALSGKEVGEEIKDSIIKANTLVKFTFGTACPRRELLVVANPVLGNYAIMNGTTLFGVNKDPQEVCFTLYAIKQINLNEIKEHLATLFLME